MRKSGIFAALFAAFFLWNGAASAAMFGDFAIPDSLSPTIQQTGAHNNRSAIVIYTQSNSYIVLYLPTMSETIAQGQMLETIAQRLEPGQEAHAFNLGGRPWFGSRTTTNGVSFYDGYTYRNNMLYPVAFSLPDSQPMSADMLQILSKVWLIPDLAHSAAASLIIQAMDQLDNGDLDAAASTLIQAEYFDSGNWYSQYLRGRVEEERESFAAARDSYQSAFSLNQYDLESAARYYAMQALTVDADQGVNNLSALATANPDEATIWEELGKVYLASEMNEEAQEYFEEALAVNPTSEAALYNLSFLYAQAGDYEDAFRRSREFYYYRPWLPNGIVPDVSAAPDMGAAKVNALLAEPLPLGYVGDYAQSVPPTLSSTQVQEASASYVVYTSPPVYQTVESYAPVINFIWNWSTRHREPWRPGYNWSRPPHNRPGHDRPRPPNNSRPPERPGNRPPGGINRPPERPGNRPPSGGNNRPPERPGNRPPSGENNRPPERPGNRPPSGENNRPPEQPGNRPPSGGGGNTTPPRPERPTPQPSPSRPQPGNRPETKPAPTPEHRPQAPAPSRPQPIQRPQAPAQSRPQPVQRPQAPAHSRPQPVQRPQAPAQSRPQPVQRPQASAQSRPQPAQRPQA